MKYCQKEVNDKETNKVRFHFNFAREKVRNEQVKRVSLLVRHFPSLNRAN